MYYVIELGDSDEEKNFIEYYFHLGYKYNDIVNLLDVYHGVTMSVRTLKRRLQGYGLKKKNVSNDEQELVDIVKKEMEGTGQLSGYRKIWHLLRINHHIHAPRKLVAQIVHDLDPQASRERKGNKLKRRKYMSYGLNHCWHIDGGVYLFLSTKFHVCMHLLTNCKLLPKYIFHSPGAIFLFIT